MSDFEQLIRKEMDRAKQEVRTEAERILRQIYEEAEKLLNQPSLKKSEVTLGTKTGRLKRALKFSLVQTDKGIEIKMWFDTSVAPHAKFVIQGTRYIKPHPILEQSVIKVLGDEYLLRSN